MASLNKKIQKQIGAMPKYQLTPEAFQSQNIARSRAFGRDRAIQMAEQDIASQASQDVATAQDVTDSTSGLLSAIEAINQSTVSSKRGLSMDEADIQRRNMGDLYAANQAVIDEKDKAWFQNVYAPWEAKLRNMQEKKMRRSMFWGNMLGGVLKASGEMIAGGGGGGGGGGIMSMFGGGGGGGAPAGG